MHNKCWIVYRVVQKTDTKFHFWDNFGNSAPILTILSLLQAEIYSAKTYSSFTHRTFIVWPHYLAKQFSVLKPMIKQRSSFVILPISNDLFKKIITGKQSK